MKPFDRGNPVVPVAVDRRILEINNESGKTENTIPAIAAALGTERSVQRPKDSDQQKEYYSGKKKRHTCKHITDSTRNKRAILLTKAKPGKIHDKRQLDEADLVGNIPDEIALEKDLEGDLEGLQNEFENVHLPHKKPKGKELSEQQKQENREFSRQRVKCVACFP